jgi:hypothetical protein
MAKFQHGIDFLRCKVWEIYTLIAVYVYNSIANNLTIQINFPTTLNQMLLNIILWSLESTLINELKELIQKETAVLIWTTCVFNYTCVIKVMICYGCYSMEINNSLNGKFNGSIPAQPLSLLWVQYVRCTHKVTYYYYFACCTRTIIH